jgi:hypothetical protein
MRKLIVGYILLSFQYLAIAQFVPGTIGSDQQICYGTAPVALTQTPASGGTGPYLYQWQRSINDGNSWINVYKATQAAYRITLLGQTTKFRRRVTDIGTQTVLYSNIITIIVYPYLKAGTIGNTQTICYGNSPNGLVQITPAAGGVGGYTYKWQSSTDGSSWFDIPGAISVGYIPSALTVDTWYKRWVIDGRCGSTASNSVKVTVLPQIVSAQLHDNVTIDDNTSTNFNVVISGGATPFTVNYTLNGAAQPTINNYVSGTNISTGVLNAGLYTYALTSVTDAIGCNALSLGTSIAITVISNRTIFTNEVPTHSDHDNRYDMGTKFKILTDGFITKVRLYSHLLESGKHEIRIWRDNGSEHYSLMPDFPIEWNFSPGTEGWREYELDHPIAVESNVSYIVSITNGLDNNWYVQSYNFIPVVPNIYVRYELGGGLYTENIGNVPDGSYNNSAYFRDIVFFPFAPGSIGNSQSICYNAVPASLTEITGPGGGSGVYSFQWQSSPDNSIWTDISGATSSGYSPLALTTSTYYRRSVTSGEYKAETSSILITVSTATNAQLHDDITLYNNTSTDLNVAISGGTSPYAINYTRNEVPQAPVPNYYSGNGISTGLLTTGSYNYTLTSIIDSKGCNANSLGNSITVTVSGTYTPPARTNKALIIVNEGSANYIDYSNYIKPYLDNFGIPYEVYNSPTPAELPELSNFAIIIFGHKNVYSSGYPISALETAINGGVGLYSFDPHLFDYPSSFNSVFGTTLTSESNQINIVTNQNPTHYITQYHVNDDFDNYIQDPPHSQQNNPVSLLKNMTIEQRSTLLNGSSLATAGTIPVLEVCDFGSGRIVKWNGYDWIYDNVLGPVYGMDDLIWRGIVWAARKPFVMQGLPPMITMRVDDVDGTGGSIQNNFEWIRISNEFGLIPWCGTFNDNIPSNYLGTLKSLIDNTLTTAAPHAFSEDNFIYFNHDFDPAFYPDPAVRVLQAKNFYDQNGLTMSKFLVPHYYEISTSALTALHNIGIEFTGTHMLYGNYYGDLLWLNSGPYRINRFGYATEVRPVYYGDNVFDFFNCVTEIRDDLGYEWFPSSNVTSSVSAGVRQLRRSLNSMVLSTLFTHEYELNMGSTSWREILGSIKSAILSYNPEFRSMDYAVQYIRERNKIKVTNVTDDNTLVNISYSGVNGMDTRCYLFTGSGNQISYRLITLPRISEGTITVIVKINNNN